MRPRRRTKSWISLFLDDRDSHIVSVVDIGCWRNYLWWMFDSWFLLSEIVQSGLITSEDCSTPFLIFFLNIHFSFSCCLDQDLINTIGHNLIIAQITSCTEILLLYLCLYIRITFLRCCLAESLRLPFHLIDYCCAHRRITNGCVSVSSWFLLESKSCECIQPFLLFPNCMEMS